MDRRNDDNSDIPGDDNPDESDSAETSKIEEELDKRFPGLRDAALQAEYDTGVREATEAQAKSGVIARIARMTLGTFVLILGIILMPLPGPGGVIAAAGLAILARDVAWAERLLRYVRRRMPGVPEDGKIPRSSLITMVFISAAALLFSYWWMYLR